jgi:dTDP-glucose 4,6-dehydratase
MSVIVTGGAGFIGSALVRHLVRDHGERVVNVDKLTYAGDLSTVADVADHPLYAFEHADVADRDALERIFTRHRPTAVYHLAAESHVDRSIDDPEAFVRTNVLGTFRLLEVARRYWNGLGDDERARFRFLHVSTDEVFGSLGSTGLFEETTPYDPSSPYASTKAASDHLVRAWHRTYGFPALITNCSNNYGPFQFPEKLIPLMITKALRGEPLPVYGDGLQVRDWLYVEDHVDGLVTVMRRGRVGESYNIGGTSESTNLALVRTICELLETIEPGNGRNRSYASLITHVADRPGHDRRYAMDTTKIRNELGWRPRESLRTGLEKTVRWLTSHRSWYDSIHASRYEGDRLGASATRPT